VAAGALEASVTALWEELLGVHAPRADDDFFELGGHSLLGASLLIRIERELGIGVPLSVLFEASRLGDFVGRLRGARAADASRFLVRVNAGTSLAPLFCVHAPARSLVEHLRPERPVYNLGHTLDPDDPGDASVEAIAQKYVAELLQVAPGGPYQLCGFSVGGMIAQAMAQRLEAAGHRVELLVLADPPPLVRRGFLHYRLRHLLSRFRRRPELVERLRFLVTEPLAMLRRRLSARRVARSHRTSEAQGRAPTEEALAFHNMSNYVRVGAQYRMRPYGGESVLFLPLLEAGFRDWVCRQWRLVLPGLRVIYEMRDATTHAQMFQSPHVECLAAILARHVEGEAQPLERATSIVPVHSTSSAPAAPMATSDA